MIRINLLPQQRRTQPWWRVGLCLGLIMLALLLGLYLYNIWRIAQLHERVNTDYTSYTLLRPAEEKMLAANALQQKLQAKQGTLLRLTQERVSWYAVLTQFGEVTPPQIQLLTLDTAAQNVVQVTGLATSYPDLAAFLARLEHDSLFTAPVLVEAEHINAGSTEEATKFVITVKIKGI